MNWSCGSGGDGRCNEATSSRIDGPHKTQQSLLSVLIAEVGDKVFFEEGQIGQDRVTKDVLEEQYQAMVNLLLLIPVHN